MSSFYCEIVIGTGIRSESNDKGEKNEYVLVIFEIVLEITVMI